MLRKDVLNCRLSKAVKLYFFDAHSIFEQFFLRHEIPLSRERPLAKLPCTLTNAHVHCASNCSQQHSPFGSHFSAKAHHRKSFSQCWTFCSLAVSDVGSLLLVCSCRFLESTLDPNFTTPVLTSLNSVSPS